MNILQLTAHFSPNIGGVETHLDDLVDGLVKRKYHITVLTYQPLSTDVAAPIFEKKDFLEIIRIPWWRGMFYQLVNKPALEFLYLFPGLFVVLPFILIRKKIQVIHAHGLVAAAVGLFWSKIFGIKIIVSTHSLYHFPKTGAYRQLVKFILSRVNKCLCLSEKSVQELQQLGLNQKKISKFVYWVDTNIFKFEKESSLKNDLKLTGQFVVLFVGRLVEEKGIRFLIKAVKQIKGRVTLIVAGDGPLRDEVMRETQTNNHIRFVGKLTNKELNKYYNLSDLLVVPSTHDEGFGRVILEALSSGTPVLGSNRGSIPEAIDDSVGRLVDISVKNLQKEIAYLKKHPNVLKKLSQNARAFALKRYSKKNISQILKLYDN